MVEFNQTDILLSIIGGILISVSTTFNLYMKGRVTGFSGIFYSIISWNNGFEKWKGALVCGLICMTSMLYNIFKFGKVWDNAQIFDEPIVMIGDLSIVGFGIAGYLVGVGTKMSNGCTSGHGVCGLPRFAPRSWASVGTFLSLAIIIATFKQYVPFLSSSQGLELIDSFNHDITANVLLCLSVIIFFVLLLKEKDDKSDIIVGFITGLIFAAGLGFGGMFRRTKILGFLVMSSNWDPSLLFLLGASVGLNMITFNYIIRIIKKPILAEKISLPSNTVVDSRLLIGSAIFGLGWGLGGICPGPAMSLFPIFSLEISVVWIICLALGQITVSFYDQSVLKSNENKSSTENLAKAKEN